MALPPVGQLADPHHLQLSLSDFRIIPPLLQIFLLVFRRFVRPAAADGIDCRSWWHLPKSRGVFFPEHNVWRRQRPYPDRSFDRIGNFSFRMVNGTKTPNGDGAAISRILDVAQLDCRPAAARLLSSRVCLQLWNSRNCRLSICCGTQIKPEFLSLYLALSVYTASYIAEIVRSESWVWQKARRGFAGNWPVAQCAVANSSLSRRPWHHHSAAHEPVSQPYQNSSLAIAIGYPDLVAVGGTILNQTVRRLKSLPFGWCAYLGISFLTSLFMNWFQRQDGTGGALIMADIAYVRTTEEPVCTPYNGYAWSAGFARTCLHHTDSICPSWRFCSCLAPAATVPLAVHRRAVDRHRPYILPHGRAGRHPSDDWSGACWAFVGASSSRFLVGRYPDAERWRVW